MGLNRIKIEGFKSIKSLDLELRPLNVLIGANGAGKSNFLSLFRLLNAVAKGNLQTHTAIGGGPDAFLYFGRKVTDQLSAELLFTQYGYQFVLIPTFENKLIFDKETGYILSDGNDPEKNNQPKSITGSQESFLSGANTTPAAQYLRKILGTCEVYHLNDTGDQAPVKRGAGLNDNLYLRPDASNLAAFLYRLQHTDRKHYEAIKDTVQLVSPFFKDFALRTNPLNSQLIEFEWHEWDSDVPFLANRLSDGTLRFICLATLLLQPNPPNTILIDEPELGLHPAALNVLAALIRSASHRTQLIISTQSASLIDEFDQDDILVVDRVDHATTIERLGNKDLTLWLEEYSLGELWEKNVFGGRP